MRRAEWVALRRRVGSQQRVGKLLDVTDRTIRTYEKGRAPRWYLLALKQLATEAEKPKP